MTKPIVYLAGPMDGREYHEVHDWRNKFKELYGAEYCLDPTRREYDKRAYSAIVNDDIEDIRNCTIMVIMWDNTPSIGTAMEMMYATCEGWFMENNIKTILINKTGKNTDQLSPWLRYNSDHIVTSLKEAVEICQNHS